MGPLAACWYPPQGPLECRSSSHGRQKDALGLIERDWKCRLDDTSQCWKLAALFFLSQDEAENVQIVSRTCVNLCKPDQVPELVNFFVDYTWSCWPASLMLNATCWGGWHVAQGWPASFIFESKPRFPRKVWVVVGTAGCWNCRTCRCECKKGNEDTEFLLQSSVQSKKLNFSSHRINCDNQVKTASNQPDVFYKDYETAQLVDYERERQKGFIYWVVGWWWSNVFT